MTEIIDRVGQYYLRRFKGRTQIYICWQDGSYSRKVSARTSDVEAAKQALARFAVQATHGKRVLAETHVSWLDLIDGIIQRQHGSARKRGHAFDIDAQYVLGLMHASGYRCPVSGIPFQWSASEVLSRGPWAPSIDRIDNRHGYVKGNVRVVCLAANIAMNAWGYDVLLRLSHGVIANHFHTVEPGLFASSLPVPKSDEIETSTKSYP